MTPLERADRELIGSYRPVVWVVAVWVLGLGVAIAAGGEVRLSGPSYAGMRGLADELSVEASVAWSAPFVLGGGLLILGLVSGNATVRIVGYCLSAVVTIMLSGSVVAAAVNDPRAGLTGAWTYAMLAALLWVLAALTVRRLRRAHFRELLDHDLPDRPPRRADPADCPETR